MFICSSLRSDGFVRFVARLTAAEQTRGDRVQISGLRAIVVVIQKAGVAGTRAIIENPMLNGGTIRLDAGQRFAPK